MIFMFEYSSYDCPHRIPDYFDWKSGKEIGTCSIDKYPRNTMIKRKQY